MKNRGLTMVDNPSKFCYSFTKKRSIERFGAPFLLYFCIVRYKNSILDKNKSVVYNDNEIRVSRKSTGFTLKKTNAPRVSVSTGRLF